MSTMLVEESVNNQSMPASECIAHPHYAYLRINVATCPFVEYLQNGACALILMSAAYSRTYCFLA